MTTREELEALADRLKERRKLKWMASCKCGGCQIVDEGDLWAAGELIAMLAERPQTVVAALTEPSKGAA